MTTTSYSTYNDELDHEIAVPSEPSWQDEAQTAINRAGRREIEVTLPIGSIDERGRMQRAVTLRKMTGREEALLADPGNQRNGGRLVTALLHSCITRIGDMDTVPRSMVEHMYSVDRNFLLLRLRGFTFGNELPASYTCPSCANRFEMTEDLNELPLRTLAPGEEPEDIVVELEDGYLDRDGNVHTSMTLRLARGDDESAVAPQMRKNPSLGKNALLARCMKSLGDLPAHRIEALGPRIMSDLTLADRRLIDRAFNEGAPGIDLIRELDCPSCGADFKATLDMTRFLASD
jgi:hypothetical protein